MDASGRGGCGPVCGTSVSNRVSLQVSIQEGETEFLIVHFIHRDGRIRMDNWHQVRLLEEIDFEVRLEEQMFVLSIAPRAAC